MFNGLPQLQSFGVPIITPATGDTILTSDTTGLVFRSRASEAEQGRALASYLIDEYNLLAIATIQLDVQHRQHDRLHERRLGAWCHPAASAHAERCHPVEAMRSAR